MSDLELLLSGAVIGFLLALIICAMALTSDWRSAEVISEYKAGKIVCADIADELVCRRKQ